MNFPATPQTLSHFISPNTVDNSGDDLVTLSASATENIGLSRNGDLAIANDEIDWSNLNRSLLSTFNVAAGQRPGTFVFEAHTGGFGGDTSGLPATLTVTNDLSTGLITGEIYKAGPDSFPDITGEIQLFDDAGDGSTPVFSSFINAMGRATYAVPAIPPGTYKLRFESFSTAVSSTWYPNAPDHDSAATLTLGAGTHLPGLHLFLPPAPFEITTHPQGVIVAQNGFTSLDVAATGPGLSFQWLLDGTPIDGATSQSLFIPSATLADSGNYRAVVTGPDGTLVSNPARLDVVTSGFRTWATDPDTGLLVDRLDDPAIAGYHANPTGDPTDLFMDYALGHHPLDPTGDPVTTVENPSGNLTLQLQIPDPAPGDVRYTIWSSTTPDRTLASAIATKEGTAPWTGSATITTVPAPGGKLSVAVEDTAPPNGTPRFLFLTASPR